MNEGNGVNVFQPSETIEGADLLRAGPKVRDSDTALALYIPSLPRGATVAFTIDVDSTGGLRETTIADSELKGAGVRLTATSEGDRATLQDTPRLERAAPFCATGTP